MTQESQLSDREHFEAIVRRYQGPLLRYVRSSLGEGDAQDVVQEVFLKLHKAMVGNGLRDITSVGTWLFKVAHTSTADALRKRKADDRAMEAAATDCTADGCVEPSGLDEVVHKEDCRLVLKLLNSLPARERQVVLLKLEHRMTYREISVVTSLAPGTVGYVLNQGLGQLARELKAAGVI